jgi:ankyrin repeat protein
MSDRRLPVRPDLKQLKHQAKDLLRAVRREDPAALAEFQEHHPRPPAPEHVKLADAQLALARSYQAPSWARLVVSCELIDAIWRDDVATVRKLVLKHPNILHENAGIRNNNWGPPLSYAANLGRDRIIALLQEFGANDLQQGLDRAVLQGRIDTARMLHRSLGSPRPPVGALGSPAYTLSVSGTEFLFAIGAAMRDENGNPDAPVDVVLESDSRRPDAKHRILEMYVENGFELPDTPMMALHRGRIDLLEAHVRRDPGLLRRTFDYEEIFPPALRCHQPVPGSYNEELPRTPLAGSTLLHVCVEFDEIEIATWLLERGMDADAPAAVDANGFGGHTALFGAVVSYPNFWMNFTGGWADSRKPQNAAFAQLLLEHGANPNSRASFREPVSGNTFRDHYDITPLTWGEVFQNRIVVSEPAMRLIAERGGHR